MKSIHLPDDLYQRAAELAEQDKVSVDRLVAALVHEHAREWSRLRGRATRGSKEKLKSVLAKVGDAEPEAFDRQ
jgi:predicted DNA-binding ribbon-helix-helix protein